MKAPLVTPDDTYALTRRGEAEIRGAETTLPQLSLELLVLIDGRASLAQLQASKPDVPYERLARELGVLLRDGLICYSDPPDDVVRFEFVKGIAGSRTRKDASAARAQREATDGMSALKREGYFVRIARRPTATRTLPQDRLPVVVIAEDEPHLARFLTHFMRFEGFEVRAAGERKGIFEALQQQPAPDLVLLDVMMPDVNGFEVLASIRQEPALRDVPVMMLTSIATREAVIKGLTHGADGYVTKPFQPHVLVKAIKTVFGLEHDPAPDPWAVV
jgi:CheY-like chemotaxis protein